MFINKLMLFPPLFFLPMMLPLGIAQNVGVHPNIMVPKKESKPSDVCFNVVRQAQMCLKAHPKCREEEFRQMAPLSEQLASQCGQWPMPQQVAPNPTLPSSAECSASGSTFMILFIIFAAGFLVAIIAIGAKAIFHFRRK